MSENPEQAAGSTAPRIRRRGKHFSNSAQFSHRGRWIALACVALLLIAVGGGGIAALRLRNNVVTSALNLGDGTAVENGALDILVIGSDTRAGSNAKYGDAADAKNTARSDVMMLVQISADHRDVNVVSFPRDLMVDIPECKDPNGGQSYPAEDGVQINESLSRGGPGCTVATVQKITGVKIDHFMLVDFNAVKRLSSVVGGVDVCVNKPIKDEDSGLDLPKGNSSVKGEQALAFLRTRHGFGDGSDTSRIRAQQAFLSSLLRKVKSEGTLSNPGRLYDMAEAITENVTVDDGLTDPRTFVEIGQILAGIDLNDIVFATVPTEPYTQDPNRLQLSDSAQDVFTKLQKDKPLTDKSAEKKSGSSDSSSKPAVDHSVPVTVSNSSGKDGRADELQQDIEKMGYTAVTAYDLNDTVDTTTITYSTGYDTEARDLAKKFGVPSSKVVASEDYAGVSLVIGKDLADTGTVKKSGDDLAGGASGQTANQSTCQEAFDY